MSEPLEILEKSEPKKEPRSANPVPKRLSGPSVPLRTTAEKWNDDEKPDSFFERFGILLTVGIAGVSIGAWIYFRPPSAKPEPIHKAPETVVHIQAPPPPPPPPPPKIQTPPPKDEKRTETPMDKPDPKPVAEKPKPAEKQEKALGTTITGGPGMAGLSRGNGNGLIGGTGTGKGGSGGSMGRWYVGQVLSKVTEAVRGNPKTRRANFVVNARAWLDDSGRITRAELVDSSGDASVDRALRDEILLSVRLAEPPPHGMRMPIPLRLTARRPN